MRRPSPLSSALLFAALAALGAGCGEGETAAGATVSVYVAAPLCKAARQELATAGGEAGDLKVRAICLAPAERKGRVDLAAAGRNARRATEDSTAVAFLESSGPAAESSRSIVESAEIAWLETGSGATAIRRVIGALRERGSSSPRSAVLDQVG